MIDDESSNSRLGSQSRGDVSSGGSRDAGSFVGNGAQGSVSSRSRGEQIDSDETSMRRTNAGSGSLRSSGRESESSNLSSQSGHKGSPDKQEIDSGRSHLSPSQKTTSQGQTGGKKADEQSGRSNERNAHGDISSS